MSRRSVTPSATNAQAPPTCDCWVASQSEQDRFCIRYGAHDPACPVYRVSLDPVDAANDQELRERHNGADLEASTFQKRPCYRYIRRSDGLPAIGTQSPIAKVKLFDPSAGWTWFISEYNPETREAFGLVDGHEAELGYFDMAELVAIRGAYGLPLERDLHWTPRPLEECR